MTIQANAAPLTSGKQLTDIAAILATGILRLRQRRSLPVPDDAQNPDDSSPPPLELCRKTLLSVFHGS